MTERTVTAKIRAEVGGFVAGVNTARAQMSAFNAEIAASAKKKQAFTDLGNTAGKVGLAAAVGLGIVAHAAMDFDKSMSRVAATGEDATNNMEALRAAAIKAGADTQFSATEAADGITALAKAGVEAKDILAGGLSGTLALAASGELDVAQAAEIAATSLNQFGLAGEQVPHVADLLAAAAGKAQGEVTDMAQALKYVGPVAAQMGVSIEETTGTIAELASQGILADQAGTSLRGMLSALTSPSKQAAKEMKGLGISMYDANGQFVGFEGIAGQLQERMSTLSNAERDQALGRIFGNEQITAARILYAGGAKDVQKWTAAVNDQGYAAESAATKMDNLSGDLEQLRGSLETFLIGAGEGAQGPLRDLTQGATEFVNVLNDLPAPLKNTAVGLLAITAVVGGGAWFGTRVITGVATTRTNLAALGVTATGTGSRLSMLGTDLVNVARYGTLATESSTRLRSSLGALTKGGGALAGLVLLSSGASESLGATNATMLGMAGMMAGPWGAAVGTGAGLLLDFRAAGKEANKATRDLAETVDEAGVNLTSMKDSLRESSEALDETISKAGLFDKVGIGLDYVTSGFDVSGTAVGKWAAEIDEGNEKADDLILAASLLGDQLNATSLASGAAGAELQDYADILASAEPAMKALGISADDLSQAVRDGSIMQMIPEIAAWIQHADSAEGRTEALAGAVADLGDESETTADKADALKKSLEALLSPQLNLSEATDEYAKALRHMGDDLDKNSRTLKGNSDAADMNRKAIRDRIEQIMDVLVAEADAGASSERLARTLGRQEDALIKAGVAAGISERDLRAYIKQMGLTPALVTTLFEQEGLAEGKGAVDALGRSIDNLHDKTVTININEIRNRRSEQYEGRANGGPVIGSRTYLVGERGPELLTMPRSGYVTPNPQMRATGFGDPSSNAQIARLTATIASLEVRLARLGEDVRQGAAEGSWRGTGDRMRALNAQPYLTSGGF